MLFITAVVVVSGPFVKKLLHNHFITEFFFKKKSGEAKDSAIFPFFFLHKRGKPMVVLCFIEHQESDIGDLYTVRGFLFLGPQIVSCAP